MKSLWSAADRRALLARLDRLSPNAERAWGTLTAHAAVTHLADSLRMALGEIREAPIPGMLRHQPIKWLAVNVLPMPKGVKGPAGYFTNPPQVWEDDVAELKRLIDACVARAPTEPWGENPFFGPLDKVQWGRLSHKHFDHHLRQFHC